MAIVAAEAPESSSHTGKGALVAQNADAAAPGWFSQYMNLDQMHKQTQMEKLHNMEQNSQLVLNKMEDMQVGSPGMVVPWFHPVLLISASRCAYIYTALTWWPVYAPCIHFHHN